MEMDMVLSVLAGVGGAVLFWKVFFRDFEDFKECVRFWLTPDIISLFRGEYGDDWWGEFKLGAWIVLSGAAGVLVYSLLNRGV